jgi:uncharacterized protein involved in type VI secretion and phage assembly
MSQTVDGPRYYGKYRGMVINNIDPENRGRVLVQVPDVLPATSSWALPCMPVTGIQSGIYAVPPLGARVWVEFEQGDLDYPIWVGGWWGTMAEVPPLAVVPPPQAPPGQNFALQTQLQNLLLISDVLGPTGGFMLKTTQGATILINDTAGITIQNGKGASITMVGPAITITGATVNIVGTGAVNINAPVVTINQGALVVT